MTGERAWPPIQIGEDEWIIMRTERSRPAALVKRFAGQGNPDRPARSYFRCVTWAERSADRRLIGRFRTLDEADAAVVTPSTEEFRPSAQHRSSQRDATAPNRPRAPAAGPSDARQPPNSAGQRTDAWEQGAVPWDAAPRRTNRYA